MLQFALCIIYVQVIEFQKKTLLILVSVLRVDSNAFVCMCVCFILKAASDRGTENTAQLNNMGVRYERIYMKSRIGIVKICVQDALYYNVQ